MRAAAVLPLVALFHAVLAAPLAPESVPGQQVDANRDAFKPTDGGATFNPSVEAPADAPTMPVRFCIIATGQDPNSLFKSPDGKEHRVDANGNVFGACSPNPQDDEGGNFIPGLGTVQAAQPGAPEGGDDSGDGSDGSFPPSDIETPPNDNSDGESADGGSASLPPSDSPSPTDEASPSNTDQPFPEDGNSDAPSTSPPDSGPSNDDNTDTPSNSGSASGSNPTDSSFTPAGRVQAPPLDNGDGTPGSADGSIPFPGTASLPNPTAAAGNVPTQSVKDAVPRLRPAGIPTAGTPSTPGSPPTINRLPRPGVSGGVKASMSGCADCKDC